MSSIVNIELPPGMSEETLINWYVQDFMSDASWETFMESCHENFVDDKHYEKALADATVNEMINIVLKQQIEEEKSKFYFFPKT